MMKRQILIDDDGYLMGMSNCPFSIDGRGSFEAELPEEMDPELVCCYRAEGEGYVLDAARRIHLTEMAARAARREMLCTRADALLRERAAIFFARAAADENDADAVIALSAYFPVWAPGAYGAGDFVVHGESPYRCAKAHDSSGHMLWSPDRAPACWRGVHARTRALALPYERPCDGEQAYRAGEWMRWTDGRLYLCRTDGTINGPDADWNSWATEES